MNKVNADAFTFGATALGRHARRDIHRGLREGNLAAVAFGLAKGVAAVPVAAVALGVAGSAIAWPMFVAALAIRLEGNEHGFASQRSLKKTQFLSALAQVKALCNEVRNDVTTAASRGTAGAPDAQPPAAEKLAELTRLFETAQRRVNDDGDLRLSRRVDLAMGQIGRIIADIQRS